MDILLFSYGQAGWSPTDQPDLATAYKRIRDINIIGDSLKELGFSRDTVFQHFFFTFLLSEYDPQFVSEIQTLPLKFSIGKNILVSGSVKDWYNSFTLIREEFSDSTIETFNQIQLFFESLNVRIKMKKKRIRDKLWIVEKC